MTARLRIARLALAAAMVAAMILGGQAARADTLWYNGDSDGRDGYNNQTGTPDGIVYDNFVVPSGFTWTITGAFSNNLLAATPTTAYWEIRTGVSEGNGGSVVASGDGADSLAATGKQYDFTGLGGLVPPLNEYTNTVSIPGVTLGPGTYWLAVVPDNSGYWYGMAATLIDTTSGTNAIGNPPGNDGNSFMSSSFLGLNFVPLSTIEGDTGQSWDVSMGVIGTATAVPEPGAIVTGLAGVILAGGYIRRRLRKAAGPVRSMPD